MALQRHTAQNLTRSCAPAASNAEPVVQALTGRPQRKSSLCSKSLKRNESSGSFFHLCACARISTEAHHPQAENSVAALQLQCAAWLARSLSMILLRPPTRLRRFLFSRSSSMPRSVSTRSSQSRPATRARWCERSASSSASSRGRLRSMSQGGRWAIRAAARHAAGFSRSHACTHRKAARKSY